METKNFHGSTGYTTNHGMIGNRNGIFMNPRGFLFEYTQIILNIDETCGGDPHESRDTHDSVWPKSQLRWFLVFTRWAVKLGMIAIRNVEHQDFRSSDSGQPNIKPTTWRWFIDVYSTWFIVHINHLWCKNSAFHIQQVVFFRHLGRFGSSPGLFTFVAEDPISPLTGQCTSEQSTSRPS